jgi:diacylglycerol kinase family enzyme
MKAAVLINAAAGAASGRLEPAIVQRLFDEHGIAAELHWVRDKDLVAAVERALRSPLDAVIAGGGDGTLSTVAAKVAGTGIPLGVLPLGTLNHFAKDLDIPLELGEAVRCIAQRSPRLIDAGEVNGRLFINNSSIGAYPQLVEEREDQRERLGIPKWLGNVTALLKALRRWSLIHVKLELNGQSFTRTTPFVFVGNNEYIFNPRRERLRDRVHAGELCVYTIHPTTLWDIVRLLWLSLRDRLSEARDFEAHFTRELTIRSSRKQMRVACDGEVRRLQTPLHYQIRPRALRVFCPGEKGPPDESHRAHFGPALRS